MIRPLLCYNACASAGRRRNWQKQNLLFESPGHGREPVGIFMQSIVTKRRVAGWLQRVALLRWGLKLGVRLFAPRHYVGAVGAVFNDAGQLLLVKHVFRPYYPWGLPGGWIEPGENPADAVRRELAEELRLRVDVKRLLLCKPQGGDSGVPPGLGLAFYCRLAGSESTLTGMAGARTAYEILAVEWVDPGRIEPKLNAIDRAAVVLAKQEFDREQAQKSNVQG